jgi:hypothetical protein
MRPRFQLAALVLILTACSDAPGKPDTAADPADQIFINDVAIVKRHGRVMSWEQMQLDSYFAGLAQRQPASLSCKERELSLVQPAVDNLVDHAATQDRKTYDDLARHQLLLIIKGGNPCDFPETNLD